MNKLYFSVELDRKKSLKKQTFTHKKVEAGWFATDFVGHWYS